MQPASKEETTAWDSASSLPLPATGHATGGTLGPAEIIPFPQVATEASGEVWQRAIAIVNRSGLCGLGEAYMQGSWQCPDSQLAHIIERLADIIPRRPWSARVPLLTYYGRDLLFNAQRGNGAFEVGRRHYDLGNDLFRAMLDPSMSYTSAYWGSGAETLEQAQNAKLELICQKLKLSPGMRVMDIGCGWGNFAHYAASKYGVEVVGLTISKEQAAFARTRCDRLPVEILLEDYRDFGKRSSQGSFDRVVSIEMIEAVGRKNLGSFFDVVQKSLTPSGLALIQVISGETFAAHAHPALNQYVLWLLRHIFPNGYLPRMQQLVPPLSGRLMLQDAQCLQGDYERTLQAWKANFDAHWPALAPHYGAEFQRMWHFYLCGCIAMFRTRLVRVYQMLYAR
jgi:cyclopropane-fatty-acyl-phospholipid synthase